MARIGLRGYYSMSLSKFDIHAPSQHVHMRAQHNLLSVLFGRQLVHVENINARRLEWGRWVHPDMIDGRM